MKAEKETRTGTIIKDCTCVHKFQDEQYGKGKRVFNIGIKKSICTVCGRESISR